MSPDELTLSIEQHLLNADSLPVTIEAEELVSSIQKSVPFENFDPNEVVMKTTVRLVILNDALVL